MNSVYQQDCSPDRKTVRTLAVLSDSIGVGIGDPVVGGWRGFAPLLGEALGAQRLVNLSTSGARVGSVRTEQLPLALRARPEAAVVLVGMNDTMRSDFHPSQLHADLDAVVTALLAENTTVVTIRYHDHARVFRMPQALRRAMRQRIADLNAIVDTIVHRHGIAVVDLDAIPGLYERNMWAVDRLHPSEFGHRKLARAFAQRFVEFGVHAQAEVSLICAGSLKVTKLDRALWLVFKGLPWLWRRSSDLVPYIAKTMLRSAILGRDEQSAMPDTGLSSMPLSSMPLPGSAPTTAPEHS